MQQERSFLRRVCVLKPFINENCPSSRRAYFSIRLAVKTSRPQLFNINCQKLFQNRVGEDNHFLAEFRPLFFIITQAKGIITK